MKSNYELWWERESQWSIELNAKNKKKNIKIIALILPGTVLVIFGIGLWTGGIAGAIGNLLPGLLFGIFLVLVTSAVLLPGNYSKRYLKLLQQEMERGLQGSGEREEFVTQMLGKDGSDAVKCLDFVYNHVPHRMRISRGYILNASIDVGCSAQIVRLKDTARIETDRTTSTVRSGGARTSFETYQIYFYYNKVNGDSKKDKYDAGLSFSDMQTRDQVVKAIREMTSN